MHRRSQQHRRNRHQKTPKLNRHQAVKLVRLTCEQAGSFDLIDEARREGIARPLGEAIQRFDTAAIFDWWIRTVSFQGISDGVAASYMRRHGSATWLEISYRLSKRPRCPKLQGYWAFNGCGYSKSKPTCACPTLMRNCPLPKHRLRNGRLNQSAYSLYFFLRDVADEDVTNWIDGRISNAPLARRHRQQVEVWREAIISPLRHVYGLGDKVLSMSLATLLLAAEDIRSDWHQIGGSFIAVDTLVHKFLHRTGVLSAHKADHHYGAACYGDHGCNDVLERVADKIDASRFNRFYPRYFPRFVQYAIWRYCAQEEFNICNGNRIDDSRSCRLRWCRLYSRCLRRPKH